METKPPAETEEALSFEAPPVPPPPELTSSIPNQPEPQHTHTKRERRSVFSVALISFLLVTSLVSVAALYSAYNLTAEVSSLQSQIAILASALEDNVAATAISDSLSTSLSALYAEVENSVVTIDCTITYHYSNPWGRQTAVTSSAQGSGFVTEYNGQTVIVTNNHVIEDASSITVTFSDGNSYTATVLGTGASNDLAVLTTDAPTSQYDLEIVSSASVSVGDSVVAIGSPYGLAGTMTTGIISALDRTITVSDDTGGSYDITGLIQTSAPINSGNSGGPLLTYDGEVIGITTAIVSGSDGLGFAVTSDTILRVLSNIL